MLYVGMILDGEKWRMYLSSVSASVEDDSFSTNVVFIDFSSPAAKKGDEVAQSCELGILRNVLTSGGAQVTIES